MNGKSTLKKYSWGLIILALFGFAFSYGIKFYKPTAQQVIAQNTAVEKVAVNLIQEGDIIFQTSSSSQSKAIQLATNSPYSHMGIIFKKGDELFVYEAVQPVKLTPLKSWIKRGSGGHFVIKRLKNSEEILTPTNLKKMKSVGQMFLEKNYDGTFEWSDDKMYCSELVWKIYDRGANVQIGALQELKDFDLSNAIVQEKMKQRYGNQVPMNEKVISPAQMFDSENLFTVLEN